MSKPAVKFYKNYLKHAANRTIERAYIFNNDIDGLNFLAALF